MSVASLQAAQRDLKAKLRKYQRRLEELRSIRSTLRSLSADWGGDINSSLTQANNKLSAGITPWSLSSGTRDSVSAMRDSGASDGNLSSAVSSLTAEINNVENKIDNLNRQIAYYDRLIRDAIAESKKQGSK